MIRFAPEYRNVIHLKLLNLSVLAFSQNVLTKSQTFRFGLSIGRETSSMAIELPAVADNWLRVFPVG